MKPQTLKNRIFKILFPQQYVTDKVNESLCALLPELIEFVRSERTKFTFNLGDVDYEYADVLVTKLGSCNLSTEVVFKSGTAEVTVYTADHGDSDDTVSLTDLGLKLVKLKKEFGINMNDSIYEGVCLLYSTKTAGSQSS
jgi:hypothetical protein